jgi:hypothetical protein
VHTVVVHVLSCVRSWDPNFSLDPMIDDLVEETEEEAEAGV